MTKPIDTVRNVIALRQRIATWRSAGETIGLVPTMGALHEGHVALVSLARKHAQRVVVSIFVNPTQFAANEDLSRYPRDEAGDLTTLAAARADLVWAPGVQEMYGPGFATLIQPSGSALGLEGDIRPQHFAGVATVCGKLFNQVAPDVAVFGEKDYQQLCVLRQLVRDLDVPLEIVALPTVREADGLARSSRNRYLSAAERSLAPALFREITYIASGVSRLIGAKKPGLDASAVIKRLCDAAAVALIASGFAKVDYVAVRDAATLGPVTTSGPEAKTRVLAAVWLGATRLIDNVTVA